MCVYITDFSQKIFWCEFFSHKHISRFHYFCLICTCVFLYAGWLATYRRRKIVPGCQLASLHREERLSLVNSWLCVYLFLAFCAIFHNRCLFGYFSRTVTSILKATHGWQAMFFGCNVIVGATGDRDTRVAGVSSEMILTSLGTICLFIWQEWQTH